MRGMLAQPPDRGDQAALSEEIGGMIGRAPEPFVGPSAIEHEPASVRRHGFVETHIDRADAARRHIAKQERRAKIIVGTPDIGNRHERNAMRIGHEAGVMVLVGLRKPRVRDIVGPQVRGLSRRDMGRHRGDRG